MVPPRRQRSQTRPRVCNHEQGPQKRRFLRQARHMRLLSDSRLCQHPGVVMEWRRGRSRKVTDLPLRNPESFQRASRKEGVQKDSSCPTDSSPLGVEARDEPLSMHSEPELWCCCSEPALDVTVEEDVEEERVFSLKSVMMTVTFPTVIASCWAVLLSIFFSLGLKM